MFFSQISKGLIVIHSEPISKRITQKQDAVFRLFLIGIFFTATEPQRIMAKGIIELSGPDLPSSLVGRRNIPQLGVKLKPNRGHFLWNIDSHRNFSNAKANS